MVVDIDFETSSDGLNFRKVLSSPNSLPDTVMENTIREFGGNIIPGNARYVRVKAKNYGVLPSWHAGTGGEAFIFIDEIDVK